MISQTLVSRDASKLSWVDAGGDVPLGVRGTQELDGLELAGVKFVEELHPDEGVEDYGEVDGALLEGFILVLELVTREAENDLDEH